MNIPRTQNCRVCVHCSTPFLEDGYLTCGHCRERHGEVRRSMGIVVFGVLLTGLGFLCGCVAACIMH